MRRTCLVLSIVLVLVTSACASSEPAPTSSPTLVAVPATDANANGSRGETGTDPTASTGGQSPDTGSGPAASEPAASGAPASGSPGGTGSTGTTEPTAPSPSPGASGAPTDGPPAAAYGPFGYEAKGMSHEVIAFINYFHLEAVEPTLDYDAISTIAYFSVPMDSRGRFEKDGAEWRTWMGSTMDRIIERAHAAGTKVVITAERFAWNGSQAAVARALLSSPEARRTAANQIADAVIERGVDGVNIDFEPIPDGQSSNFVKFVRLVRKTLDARKRGLQVTYDSTGYIHNYDVKALAKPGAADAVYIMGYQYRGVWSNQAGSTAPLGGLNYDVTDTVRRFLRLTTPDKIILGVPLFGWSWRTSGSGVRSRVIGGSKPLFYGQDMDALERYGKRYDRVEQVAWTAYRSGGAWRQLYLDDVRALEAKWDLVIRKKLRGTGLWALGFELPRSDEIYEVLERKFLTRTE